MRVRQAGYWILGGTAALAAGAVALGLLLPGAVPPLDESAETAAGTESGPESGMDARAGGPLGEAWRALEGGRTEEAFVGFQTAAAARPDDPAPRLGLLLVGVLWMDGATIEAAAAELDRLRPDGPEAGAAAAARLLAAGDPAAAAAAAGQLLAADPGAADPGVADPGPAEAGAGDAGTVVLRVILARALLAEGQPCGALAEAGAALRLRPGMWEAEMIRLAAVQALRDSEAELAQIEALHRNFPDRPEPLEWLLEAYRAHGDDEAAFALLREEALKEESDPGPALGLAALVREARGEDAALTELDRLAEAAAGTPLGAWLRVEAALGALRGGDVAAATERLSALVADPALPAEAARRAQVGLAEARAAAGAADEALALLGTVLEADPGDVEALALQAELLLDGEQPREALDAVRLARAQNPVDTRLMMLEARALQANGRDALAGDTLARAVEASDGGQEEIEVLAAFLRSQGRDSAAEALLAREGGGDAPAANAPSPTRPSPESSGEGADGTSDGEGDGFPVASDEQGASVGDCPT